MNWNGVNGMEMKEAIDIICSEYTSCENKALKDAYRKAINALEREKPIEPYRSEWIDIDGLPYDLCPYCSNPVSFIGRKISYCPRCGQALLW